MKIKEVDGEPSMSRRGRLSPFQPVYDRLAKLDDSKWLEVTADSEDEFRKLLTSFRAHRNPKMRTRTKDNTVIFVQERRK